MQTAQDILNRIRWDKQFTADAEFKVGYYDRVDNAIIKIAFKDLRFPAGDHFSFEIVDDNEDVHSIPYHRVREIYRNGQLIWRREH